ncbi:MAG TPA: OmpA family protein [Burkholderiales bacterium]|nr:OmpA family protein [Burkholderiales bacterium]
MSIRYGWWLVLGMLGGCATVPDPNPALEKARVEYELIQSDPQVVQHAPTELSRAETLLQETQQAWAESAPAERVEHLAYLTSQQASLARETAKLRAAEAYVARAGLEQTQVQLDLRTRQAEAALRQAQLAQEEARLARENLDEMQASQREAALAAELARVAERDRLLREGLNAKDTERGLVVALNELRFAPNQAELQAGANRSLDRLAQILTQYPHRTIRIEGFTDNTGSNELNQKLSEQRADAVRQALIEKGVDAARIEIEGFGKENPVASNDTAAGRQLNRRVEVVILEDAAENAAGSDTLPTPEAGSDVPGVDDEKKDDDGDDMDAVTPPSSGV